MQCCQRSTVRSLLRSINTATLSSSLRWCRKGPKALFTGGGGSGHESHILRLSRLYCRTTDCRCITPHPQFEPKSGVYYYTKSVLNPPLQRGASFEVFPSKSRNQYKIALHSAHVGCRGLKYEFQYCWKGSYFTIGLTKGPEHDQNILPWPAAPIMIHPTDF